MRPSRRRRLLRPRPHPPRHLTGACARRRQSTDRRTPGTWAVQVIATRDRAMAGSVLKRLASKGYPAFLVNPPANAKAAYYQGPRRPLQRSRRSGKGVAADQKRRTVPVLDYALALLSGALLALSFPKFGHPACAWLALTPLVVAVVRAPRAARRGARFSSDS